MCQCQSRFEKKKVKFSREENTFFLTAPPNFVMAGLFDRKEFGLDNSADHHRSILKITAVKERSCPVMTLKQRKCQLHNKNRCPANLEHDGARWVCRQGMQCAMGQVGNGIHKGSYGGTQTVGTQQARLDQQTAEELQEARAFQDSLFQAQQEIASPPPAAADSPPIFCPDFWPSDASTDAAPTAASNVTQPRPLLLTSEATVQGKSMSQAAVAANRALESEKEECSEAVSAEVRGARLLRGPPRRSLAPSIVAATGVVPAVAATMRAAGSPSMRIDNCKFYMTVGCKKGKTCKFNHPTKTDMPNCPFHMKSVCQRPTTCNFNHPQKGLSGLPDAVAAAAPAPKVASSTLANAAQSKDK
jgi:hypothetical protein